MLPGVGAFGASLKRLKEHGLDAALVERITGRQAHHRHLRRPPAAVREQRGEPRRAGARHRRRGDHAFPATVRTPQFGWNEVRASEGCNLLDSGHAYFANSYRATAAPGWQVATAEHGGRFVAAMERGNVIGCQFHPELSGDYGAALLSRFLELG
jgi:imidazole glycerol-phosphate synthase subunit HisH